MHMHVHMHTCTCVGQVNEVSEYSSGWVQWPPIPSTPYSETPGMP